MKTALVVGASRGIGLEFVRQLCARGMTVHATARDERGLKALERLGAKASVLDVAKPKSIEDFLAHTQGERFDLILHVAGVFGPRMDATKALSLVEFDEVMHTNVGCVVQLLPALIPCLNQASGKWISISSVMASMSLTTESAGWVYKISKAALNMALHAASKTYKGLTLVVMSPGWVQTDMGSSAAPLSVDKSVSSMLHTIERIGPENSGEFLNHDGMTLTW